MAEIDSTRLACEKPPTMLPRESSQTFENNLSMSVWHSRKKIPIADLLPRVRTISDSTGSLRILVRKEKMAGLENEETKKHLES